MKPTTHSLTELFRLATESVEIWREDELHAIFRHQLDTPLDVDLGPAQGESMDPALTFGQLLRSPNPSIERLRQVKQFAKSCGSRDDGRLPRQVAAALYISAIAAATIGCDEPITESSAEELGAKLSWAASLDWLPDDLRETLARATDQL